MSHPIDTPTSLQESLVKLIEGLLPLVSPTSVSTLSPLPFPPQPSHLLLFLHNPFTSSSFSTTLSFPLPPQPSHFLFLHNPLISSFSSFIPTPPKLLIPSFSPFQTTTTTTTTTTITTTTTTTTTTACLDAGSTTDRWLSRLEASNWLTSVGGALSCGHSVARYLDNGGSVLLRGGGEVDNQLVVSSIAQVLLNPDCRTIVGWVMVGLGGWWWWS